MGRRRRSKRGVDRRRSALEAQAHLLGLMDRSHQLPEALVQSCAVHLMNVSQRHRLPIPASHRHLVCRKCWAPHSLASNVRVRIHGGQRIATCLVCSNIRRLGGGPKAHRRSIQEVMP